MKADAPQWRARGESRPCGRHTGCESACQDRMVYRRNGSRHVILLADGAGTDSALGAEGISEILRRAGEMIADEDFDYMNMEEDELRERVGRCVRGTIRELAGRLKVPEETFASTFLAVCADEKAGTWCSFHLGDGAILCRAAQCRVISYPMNGFEENETILTTGKDAFSMMKIRRSYLDDCTAFSLLTDGLWDAGLRNCPRASFEAARSGDMLGRSRAADDCAAIMLYRVPRPSIPLPAVAHHAMM